MTNEQILKKAIEKAVENGYKLGLELLNHWNKLSLIYEQEF